MSKTDSGKNRIQTNNIFAENKAPEEALRQSENQLRLVTDAIPALIAYVDREHRYRFVNRKYFEWFGKEPSEIIGKHLLEIIGEKAYAMMQPHLKRVFAGEKFSCEQLVNYGWAESRFVQIDFLPDFEADGKTVKGYYALVQDIDGRKRAEDRLRETNAVLNAINLNTPTLIYVKDRESRILSANPATCKVIGKNLSEIVGKNHAEYMNDEAEGAIIHANDLRIIESGKTETFEEEVVVQNDGNLHIFLSTKTPYRDETGEIIGLIGVSVDITERKKAEETLRESEERLRLATNAAEMFSWETDIATKKIKWSENAAEIIGCAPEDLPNHTADGQFFVLPEDKENLDFEFGQILKEGITNYIFEFRGNEPEADRKFWQAQGLIIYDEKLNPVRIVGVTQNVTARKRAEQERERLLESEQLARHEAENANRLKDEFLATVSHELRTPLNAILGWASIARKKPVNAETTDRALEIIERSARQQNQIIADILDVSRIITGKLHLNIMPVNLSEIINSAIETVRPTLDAKRIKLETVFDPNASIISGDANRLQQIMWNLLTNAAKFAETDGQVSVFLRGSGAFAEVTVTDNGIGIEPEFLPFVFDRFRQADGGMNRKHGGLGLGLSIVRHLTEAHGGSISVESCGKGTGASFTVRFLLNIFQNKAAEKVSEPAVSTSNNQKTEPLLGGIRILLVDDDPDALDLAATILRTNGAIVITADSADNALRKLKHNIPDIIISDIGMPEKSGNDLIREIRALYGTKIPAIALTAYARPEDRRQIIEAGFDLHFPKPIEADLLVSMIKKLF